MKYENVCKRCNGKGTVTTDEDHDVLMSCPDCEGSGENFDIPDEGEPSDIPQDGK